MLRPKVSIVVPAYNAEQFIRDALDSVLRQSFAAWEMIVVDDGSTDCTHEFIESYARKDNRIKGISHVSNRGLSSARNTGMRYSKGSYIAFLDSDDCWSPDKLEKQVAYLDESPGIKATFTGIEIIDEKNNVIETWEKIHQRYPDSCVNASLLITRNNIIVGGGSTVMMRRSLIEEIGYFDESMRTVEDWDYWYRVAQKVSLFLVPLKLAQIRRHNRSLQANSINLLLGKLMFIQKARTTSSEELVGRLNAIEAETLYRLMAYYWHSRNAKKLIRSFTSLLVKYPQGTIKQIRDTLARKIA